MANNDESITHDQVLSVLNGLVAGEVPRDVASYWARQFLTLEGKVDSDLWEAIASVMMADLEVSPGVYLYGEVDFKHWRTALLASKNPVL